MTGALRRVRRWSPFSSSSWCGTGVADRLVGRTPAPDAPRRRRRAVDAEGGARRRRTESSAWFCAGGSGAQGGAPATIVLTNAGHRPVHGTVTAVTALAAGAPQPAPWAGARTVAVTVPAERPDDGGCRRSSGRRA